MALRGEPLRWLLAAVDEESDDCIEWPFSRRKNGYGRVRFNGEVDTAHRVALVLAGQAPPTPRAHALHICDNPPCVNPRHLGWGTQAENMQQMAQRHRGLKGLTPEQVQAIAAYRRESADG